MSHAPSDKPARHQPQSVFRGWPRHWDPMMIRLGVATLVTCGVVVVNLLIA